MNAAPEAESRRTEKLKVIVVKDTELKYRDSVIQYISRKLNLRTGRVGHRRAQTPGVADGEKAGVWATRKYCSRAGGPGRVRSQDRSRRPVIWNPGMIFGSSTFAKSVEGVNSARKPC